MFQTAFRGLCPLIPLHTVTGSHMLLSVSLCWNTTISIMYQACRDPLVQVQQSRWAVVLFFLLSVPFKKLPVLLSPIKTCSCGILSQIYWLINVFYEAILNYVDILFDLLYFNFLKFRRHFGVGRLVWVWVSVLFCWGFVGFVFIVFMFGWFLFFHSKGLALFS